MSDEPEPVPTIPPPPRVPAVGVPAHEYTSTACFHGAHDKCRRVCKFCPARCACACHEGDEP